MDGTMLTFHFDICRGIFLHPNLFDWFLVLNATFSNISAISWRPVLVVEEAGVPERTTDHGQATGKLYHLWLRVECTLFCNLQSQAQTHAVLVIGLYELLGNPTNSLSHPGPHILIWKLLKCTFNIAMFNRP